MQVAPDVLKELKAFNRNVEWLKAQSIKKVSASQQWGPYGEAAKILPRSKEWYKKVRLGFVNGHGLFVDPKLVSGSDWRMIGNRVEYNLSSIINLKNAMAS